jgi:hypothetical protein
MCNNYKLLELGYLRLLFLVLRYEIEIQFA